MSNPESLPSADVCVVGAGPAGLVAASTLGSAGRRVLVLESGSRSGAAGSQELNRGECEGSPYHGLVETRHRGIGGTANVWDVLLRGRAAAKYVPLSRDDLDAWPIAWDELEPFYRGAQEVCGLGPFEYGAEHWARPGCAPFDPGESGLRSGIYQFGMADRFTRDLPARLAQLESVTLAPSTTVTGIAVDPGTRRATAVLTANPGGRVTRVEARTVILACGAVENARLLLLSGIGDREGGTWLGRGFMEHPRDFSLMLEPSSPEVIGAASFYDLHAAEDGTLFGGRLELDAALRREQRLPHGSLTLVPRLRRGSVAGLRYRARRRLPMLLGKGTRRYGWSAGRTPPSAFDALRIVLNLEQRPDRENRVELGRGRDRFENPLPRLVLRWTEQEQAGLDRLRRELGRGFETAGLGRLRMRPGRPPDLNGHHHAGTTRMAETPAGGVVDPQGRVFGLDNLFVAGASVFPTAGFANPTLTIVALALRLARHLLEDGARAPRGPSAA